MTTNVRLPNMGPLLRWAGSKRKLIPILAANVPEEFGRYIEPFAGSACLFFSLAPKRALLGDFNKELLSFYRTVKTDPGGLYRRVSAFPASKDFYYQLRAEHPSSLDRLGASARFLYLNRFCFNGVYRTNRSGHFNVPFGSRTGSLPSLSQIENASSLLQKTTFSSKDFETTIACAKSGDFVYMDPPYTASRYRGEYGYGAFSAADLGRLESAADFLHNSGATFLISYKYDEALKSVFARWFQATVKVRRNVAGFIGDRRIVTELIISNRPLVEVSE